VRVQGAFRPMVCSARRPADWPRPPPEPRSARYPAPRPARRAVSRRRAFTKARCTGSFCLHTRGAWADGGVPRAAGVRRRACQARQDGGPGSERPEGTTPPFLSMPSRKLRARREQPQPTDARRDGREVEVRRRPIRRRRALDHRGGRPRSRGTPAADQAKERTRPPKRSIGTLRPRVLLPFDRLFAESGKRLACIPFAFRSRWKH
jgi:hypothetical protein